MRTLREIHDELDEATSRRARLWEELSGGHDAEKSAEVAALKDRIEALWAEARVIRARLEFGDAEAILSRARAEERLERESRRLKKVA